MHRRDRAGLNQLRQFALLRLIKPRRLTRRLAIHQPRRAISIEPQYPVAEGLQANPASLRAVAPQAAVVDHRKRQQPTHLIRIVGLVFAAARHVA